MRSFDELLQPDGNSSGKMETLPKVLLIVGYKKVGKTTLIEKGSPSFLTTAIEWAR